jgi:hypothetical protein
MTKTVYKSPHYTPTARHICTIISWASRDTPNPSHISSKTLEKQDEMGRACSKHGNERKSYRILEGKPVGRPKLRREDNIKTDLRKIG